ncbi:MAG: alcohol dehydrogenase catalytic domain-containing protein [Chloroflexi bacterium]|nr:alcohol dehydrogenase catalytic domain-containing protein [Chloroflexota bacterium]
MKQVVLRGPHDIAVVDNGASAGEQLVAPDHALVRLRLAGVCGSDLAAFRGTSPQVSYPRVLGHELLVERRWRLVKQLWCSAPDRSGS